MTGRIEKLEPFDSKTRRLNAIIETPIGSRVKYSYDPETGLFALTKVLPAGMAFPYNFGFIPQTKAEDGDPLDVLMLNEQPLFPGCFVKVRLIGVVKAEQTKHARWVRNDRLVGEALGKELPLESKPLKLDKHTVSQIEFFFSSYNSLFGQRFRVIGIGGPQKALELTRQACVPSNGE